MNVGGVPYNFIVVHQGLPGTMYDSSCDGTWLLMDAVYGGTGWVNGAANNDYAASIIHSYLNGDFFELFDSNIKGVIKQVKLPYTNGKGNTGSVAVGSNGISTKIFMPSYAEVGYTSTSTANVEGAVFAYFNGVANSVRRGYYNGSAVQWWLRSPLNTNSYQAWFVHTTGAASNYTVTSQYGVRPALVLPTNLGVSSDGMVTLSNKAITGTVTITGVQRELTGEGYINIGGVLRDLSDSQGNIGGILKSLKG